MARVLSENQKQEIRASIDRGIDQPKELCRIHGLEDHYYAVQKLAKRYEQSKLKQRVITTDPDDIEELARHILHQDISFEDLGINEIDYITHFQKWLAVLSTKYKEDPQSFSALTLTFLKLQNYKDSLNDPMDKKNTININISLSE